MPPQQRKSAPNACIVSPHHDPESEPPLSHDPESDPPLSHDPESDPELDPESHDPESDPPLHDPESHELPLPEDPPLSHDPELPLLYPAPPELVDRLGKPPSRQQPITLKINPIASQTRKFVKPFIIASFVWSGLSIRLHRAGWKAGRCTNNFTSSTETALPANLRRVWCSTQNQKRTAPA